MKCFQAVYWYHHIMPMTGFLLFFSFICAKKRTFREFLKRELKEKLGFACCKTFIEVQQ